MISGNLIVIILMIIAAFIVLRFVVKIIAKIIAFLVILVLIGYLLFFWNGGLLDLGNKDFMLNELEQKYCVEQKDEVKCDCIVKPLINDIEDKYTAEEITQMQERKLKSLRVIVQSLKENKTEIQQCLKERNAEGVWKDFLQDLKNTDVKNEIQEAIDEVAEETN